MIEEKAYAKINLYLKVGKLNKDNYHEIETLMIPIDFYDSLFFEENEEDKIILQNNNIPNNSILKAANLFKEKYRTKGATIKCIKRIPLCSGLGGSSTDASATLRGLNRLFGLSIPLDELVLLANQIGSDNAFCLYNKPAICRGRGEVLEFVPFPFSFYIAIFKPNYGFNTKEVYSKVNSSIIKRDYFSEIVECLKSNNFNKLNKILVNDLFLSVVSISKDYESLVNNMRSDGMHVSMSGSGASLFYLVKDNNINLLNKYKTLFIGTFKNVNTLS